VIAGAGKLGLWHRTAQARLRRRGPDEKLASHVPGAELGTRSAHRITDSTHSSRSAHRADHVTRRACARASASAPARILPMRLQCGARMVGLAVAVRTIPDPVGSGRGSCGRCVCTQRWLAAGRQLGAWGRSLCPMGRQEEADEPRRGSVASDTRAAAGAPSPADRISDSELPGFRPNYAYPGAAPSVAHQRRSCTRSPTYARACGSTATPAQRAQ
jgi:hypothetical protein